MAENCLSPATVTTMTTVIVETALTARKFYLMSTTHVLLFGTTQQFTNRRANQLLEYLAYELSHCKLI